MNSYSRRPWGSDVNAGCRQALRKTKLKSEVSKPGVTRSARLCCLAYCHLPASLDLQLLGLSTAPPDAAQLIKASESILALENVAQQENMSRLLQTAINR